MDPELNVPAPAPIEGAPAPAAPVAPAPNPLAPAPAPEIPAPAAPAPTPAAPPAPTPVAFEPSGDAALDIVLGFIGKSGFGADSPEVQAASSGDFTKLEEAFKAKGVTDFEKYVALGKSLYEKNTKDAEAKALAERAVILDAVGGPQAWEEIKTWVGANAEDTERTAINAAFAAGGIAAKAMAGYLKQLHARSPGYTAKGRDARNPDAGQGGTPSHGALSPDQYKAAIADLVGTLRGRPLESAPEYRQLQLRRLAYRE